MSLRYQGFTLTGTNNIQKFDTGIESNQAEPKKLIALLVTVSEWAANRIQIYLDNEQLASIYDYNLDTIKAIGSADGLYSTTKIRRIDLEIDIPLGQRVKAGMHSGATAKTMYGCYVYEVPD